MKRTLKSKFTIFVISFIIFAVGIPLTFLISKFDENFNQRAQVLLETTLDMLVNGINTEMMFGDSKNVHKIVDDVANYKGIEKVRIFDNTGKIKFSNIQKDVNKNILKVAPHCKNFNNINKRKIILQTDAYIYSVIEPIKNQEYCRPCHGKSTYIGFLDIQLNFTKAEHSFYFGTYYFLYFAMIVIFCLSIGFYFFFNNFINKPLTKFMVALNKIEKGNLEAYIYVEKNDEFGIIGNHFNNMVTKLIESKSKIEEMHNEQLQRTDKLVTLGELTAEIAHEVNNPAGIIMSRADFVYMDMKNNALLNKYSEDLETIINQTLKISNITSNILRYSKKMSKDFKSVNLIDIISHCLVIIEPVLNKKNIKINCNYKKNPALIWGDPYQIDQIFTNLIMNSYDALNENGKIEISISNNLSQQIIVEINDNGAGINELDLKHIFMPFYSTKKNDKGTGLGLYIVSKICKIHNASLDCKSKINDGTKFTIIFPEYT